MIIAITFKEYFFLKFNSNRFFPTHSFFISSSTIETSFDNSIASRSPELNRFLAILIPESFSGNTTLSAPTFVKILKCISLEHLAITVGTPNSLHCITVITLDSILPAMATMTISTLEMPNLFKTSASVVSAHLQKGNSVETVFTMFSFESTAITSAPLFTNSFATDNPYLPSPKTA